MTEAETSKRPIRITLIAWFFIIWALLTVIPKVFLLIDPESLKLAEEFNRAHAERGFLLVPMWIQLVHAFLGVIVLVVSGIFMLKGRPWALVLFLFWLFTVIVLTLLVTGLSVSFYAKTAVAVVIAILLLMPKSLAWFSN